MSKVLGWVGALAGIAAVVIAIVALRNDTENAEEDDQANEQMNDHMGDTVDELNRVNENLEENQGSQDPRDEPQEGEDESGGDAWQWEAVDQLQLVSTHDGTDCYWEEHDLEGDVGSSLAVEGDYAQETTDLFWRSCDDGFGELAGVEGYSVWSDAGFESPGDCSAALSEPSSFDIGIDPNTLPSGAFCLIGNDDQLYAGTISAGGIGSDWNDAQITIDLYRA